MVVKFFFYFLYYLLQVYLFTYVSKWIKFCMFIKFLLLLFKFYYSKQNKQKTILSIMLKLIFVCLFRMRCLCFIWFRSNFHLGKDYRHKIFLVTPKTSYYRKPFLWLDLTHCILTKQRELYINTNINTKTKINKGFCLHNNTDVLFKAVKNI